MFEDSPPPQPRREPSMADVALAAGVSGQTVSRVATGKGVVKESTRRRVVAAMQELGYRPNSAARALKFGRYRSIGVIMFSLSSFGNMRTLDAIATDASAAGYSINLIPLRTATQSSVSGAFARLNEQAVDGIIIVIEAHRLADSEIELPAELPVVVIDSDDRYHYPVVDTDQAQGARLATEHLLDLGHKTVWHVAGPEESYSAHRRRQSWERTLRERGATVPEVIVGDWSAESGHRAGAWLAQQQEVTAVFAANDQMALGILRALHEAGRRVPDEISVVGFDDMAESAEFWPPLTTIRQHFDQVGALALRSLVATIERHDIEPAELVQTELIVRASTASPPAADA
ncbi:LacI family DNA-binding transcriptional regulator [Microbacterium sp. 2FI]|uniref:LacI family DNA-binding transcriptional regulator n=1 Tax=Microbacterium sp. 2FI TaxID=2502193 RepID=UPI002016C593|nr:LacI family DNA-binding transcriptional regulator [Microbacterium sp. 2FI]